MSKVDTDKSKLQDLAVLQYFDIANAFYINKLFTTATRLKTIVVVDEAALTGSLRGQAFKDLIIRLTNLFVNPDDLVKSLMLVFTKARDIDDFRQELVSLTEEIKSTLTNKKRVYYAF